MITDTNTVFTAVSNEKEKTIGRNKMAKNKEHKEVIEIPEKVGFGTRDCYIVTETLDQRITYIKNGKGDEEIIFVIEEIKKKDPEAIIERGDKKLSVNLSRSFEVKTYKAPRQQGELNEREKNRLKDVI